MHHRPAIDDRCPRCNAPVNTPYIAEETTICADRQGDIGSED